MLVDKIYRNKKYNNCQKDYLRLNVVFFIMSALLAHKPIIFKVANGKYTEPHYEI